MSSKFDIAIKSKRKEQLNEILDAFRLDSARPVENVECDSGSCRKSGRSSGKWLMMVRSGRHIRQKILRVQNLESFNCLTQDCAEEKSDSLWAARFRVVPLTRQIPWMVWERKPMVFRSLLPKHSDIGVP
jgi:hypothetical protein